MEDNGRLPPVPRYETRQARADAMELLFNGVLVPLPAGTTDDNELMIVDHEQAEGAEDAPEAAGSTVLNAGDEASEGHVPNDVQLQLVLRNAHPLQDESFSPTERMNALNSLERERKESRHRWRHGTQRSFCVECGKRHPPPHLSQEQIDLLNKAINKGRQLRKEFEESSTVAGPSQNDTNTANVGAITVRSAPPKNKGKSILCIRCAKWHPGGANGCKTPFCGKCGLHHLLLEDCEKAKKRFSRVAEAKEANRAKGKSTTPSDLSSSAAASSSDFDLDKFKSLYSSVPHTEENMKRLGSLFDSLTSTKRPAEEPAKKAGSAQQEKKNKNKNKRAGKGDTCSGPKPHQKGPEKPDDKGKGRAMQA